MTGVPTRYRGTDFRSLAEARWACFFDAYGVRWLYESQELPGYLPDFLLPGPHPALVEVRGGASTHDALSAELASVLSRIGDRWRGFVVVAGAAPLDHLAGDRYGMSPIALGAEVPTDFGGPDDVVNLQGCGLCGAIGLCGDAGSFELRPCGHYDGDHHIEGFAPTVTDAWRDAVAKTRWRAR